MKTLIPFVIVCLVLAPLALSDPPKKEKPMKPAATDVKDKRPAIDVAAAKIKIQTASFAMG